MSEFSVMNPDAGPSRINNGLTSANHLQIEPFGQASRAAWELYMAQNAGKRGGERTTVLQKNQYIHYLRCFYEKGLSAEEAKKRSWVLKSFELMETREETKLIRKPTEQFKRPREVKSDRELADIIIDRHISLGHAGQNATVAAVLHDFYGVTREEILALVRHCAICARTRASNSKGPLIPIKSSRVFERVQIDLIDMRHDPDWEFLWICHMEDHFSKFHQLYALPKKEAYYVARKVHEWITAFGIMEILQSDNGTEFKGVCQALLLRYGVKVINGRPRTPRTQGLVEQANGTVKERIISWKRQNGSAYWADGLGVSLYSYSPHHRGEFAPFILTFTLGNITAAEFCACESYRHHSL